MAKKGADDERNDFFVAGFWSSGCYRFQNGIVAGQEPFAVGTVMHSSIFYYRSPL
jgi:hypothetical protein